MGSVRKYTQKKVKKNAPGVYYWGKNRKKMETEVFFDYSLDYDKNKDKDEMITCRFKRKYSPEDREVKEAVQECIQWAGSFTGKVIINDDEEFELKITGRGHDNRCTWCRSFRTRLRNILAEKKIKLRQKGFCRFDKEERYGTYLIEELGKRIKLYDTGLSDESKEDIEMARKALKELEE